MTKPSILISAVGGDIGASAVRSLRDEAGLIVGCDMKPYPAVFDLLDSFYEAPPAGETEAYIAFLKGIMTRHRIDAFLPVSEPELAVLNDRREEIEETGVKLLLNNKTILDHFLDKYEAAQYLSAMGLAVPGTATLKDYDGCYGFPLIIKPRRGYGNKKAWIVEDEHDLAYARRKDNGLFLVQEYIGSDREEYTTGAFSDGRSVSSITFRRRLGFGSLSAEAVLVDTPYMEQVSEKIARATALVGSINIQTRRVNDMFVIFEVNPRLSSTLLFRKKFGFDDAVWWLNVLRGKPYSFKKQYRSGRAVRFVSECYFDMEKI
jgi:carbamoyl-phosphate synthase large subunit